MGKATVGRRSGSIGGMGYVDGLRGWATWMGYVDGLRGWATWMGYVDGLRGWATWVGYGDGLRGWATWTAYRTNRVTAARSATGRSGRPPRPTGGGGTAMPTHTLPSTGASSVATNRARPASSGVRKDSMRPTPSHVTE